MLTKILPKSASSGQDRSFAAFVNDNDTKTAVIRAAGDFGIVDPVVVKAGFAEAVRQLTDVKTPKLLIVDLSGVGDPLTEIASLAEVCDEGTRVVTVGEANDVNLYRSLVALGIQDYLVKPVSSEGFSTAFARAEQVTAEPQASESTLGRLISVVGSRGGVGASSLAVNCAWAMAHEQGLRVALVDLDLFFGTSGLHLDLESGRGFREALENPSRIDGLFIERAMVRESDNLFVLSAEEPLDSPLSLDPSSIEMLLENLRSDFQCVVMDVPRFGARTQITTLQAPATALVVSDPSLAGMRDTMRLAGLFKKSATAAETKVVINRMGASKSGELEKADFERGAELKVDHVIPYDPKPFAASASSGKPLLKVGGGSKAVKAIRELSQLLSGPRADAAKMSVWQRLLKGRG
jgi:pilus assembly protein CpaE